MKLETLKQKMDAAHYIYDDTLATVLTVALQLGRPLLIEGHGLCLGPGAGAFAVLRGAG